MREWLRIGNFVLLMSAVLIPGSSPAGPPDWSVNPAEYQYTGSVTASVYRELADVGSAGDMLGAFLGEECRGVVDAWESPGSDYLFLITVYSNQAAGESLNFSFYDSDVDVVCHIEEQVEFTADMIVGGIASPMEMHIDGCQPFVASNPVPCNLCWQDTVGMLSWYGGDSDVGDSVVYYVHLGTEADPPVYDTTEVYDGSVTEISYIVAPALADGSTYHWKIVAKDSDGMTTHGPIWTFYNAPDAVEPTPWGRIKMLFE